MRDIEFRGKRSNGEWVYGSLIALDADSGYVYITMPYTPTSTLPPSVLIEGNTYLVDPNTVGQYTGLKDKNGTKIYENDIVTMPSYNGGRHKTVVYFDSGKFAVDGSHYHFKDIRPKNMEVIGNIHDNPELL